MNSIHKIPTEVLEEIFFRAIDGPISNTQEYYGFPWAIGRVCKSWRSAFITNPDLWTWITINLAESHSREQDLDAANRCLSLCLDRSRNYSLNISFHLPTKDLDEKSRPFALLWHSFLSCSHRWQIIHLTNLIESHLVALNACTGATPILESLTIQSPMEISDQTNVTGFQIAPLLTRFTLSSPAVTTFAMWSWPFPWMQLTYLMLRVSEIIGVDQLSAPFKQLRDIEELHFILEEELGEQGIELGDFIHTPENPHYLLQRLRVLRVCCVEPLSLITAPSLSELYLEGSAFFYPLMRGEPNFPLAKEIFECFTLRSSCKIHKLTLSDFSGNDFTPFDNLFPDVDELYLVDALTCLELLLLLVRFPVLRVLDVAIAPNQVNHALESLLKILQLRNCSSAEYSVIPLTKVILRPVLGDKKASATPVTAVDWTCFEDHVQLGQWCVLLISNRQRSRSDDDGNSCELNLTNQPWSPVDLGILPP